MGVSGATRRWSVVIVGDGPAGVAAAFPLGGAGHRRPDARRRAAQHRTAPGRGNLGRHPQGPRPVADVGRRAIRSPWTTWARPPRSSACPATAGSLADSTNATACIRGTSPVSAPWPAADWPPVGGAGVSMFDDGDLAGVSARVARSAAFLPARVRAYRRQRHQRRRHVRHPRPRRPPAAANRMRRERPSLALALRQAPSPRAVARGSCSAEEETPSSPANAANGGVAYIAAGAFGDARARRFGPPHTTCRPSSGRHRALCNAGARRCAPWTTKAVSGVSWLEERK